MGITVLLILIVAVVVSVFAYRVIVAWRGRIRSLSPERKATYAQSWRAIQAHFPAAPRAAVDEAEQLAISILRDRGAKMSDGWRPPEMHLARELARANEGNSTEGLRSAMLQYEVIVNAAVGEPMRKSMGAQSQEGA